MIGHGGGQDFNPFEAVRSLMDRYKDGEASGIWDVEAKALLEMMKRGRKSGEQRGKDEAKRGKKMEQRAKLISKLIEEAQASMNPVHGNA